MDEFQTFEQFRNTVGDGGVVVRGFIYPDPAQPDGILFGMNPLTCPTQRIPQSLIQGIRVLGSHLCLSPGGAIQVSYAEVKFKRASSPDGKLFESIIVGVTEAAIASKSSASGQKSSCGCGGAAGGSAALDGGQACNCTNVCLGFCTFGNRCTGVCA